MAVNTRQHARLRFMPAIPADPIWRLSIDQYHQMTQTGILTDDDPIELLEGWLVTKMPKNPPHRLSTQLTREALARLLPSQWHVNDQEPITTEDSEPEPDVSIIRGERRQYLERHPASHEVSLVVEVADTTLPRDRTTKKRLYARAAIPVYWIINLTEQQIEVYTAPSGSTDEPDYQQRHDYTANDSIPLIIDDQEIGHLRVRDLLP
jgi:Uma2 family endonuclease